MKSKLKENQKGFTIIEVLIVLAIAGLIMVIVFLAVPALQRNSRNTQRTSDASRVSSAVNECLTNNNGSTTTCAPGTLATGTTGIIQYVTIANNQQLTTTTAGLDGLSVTYGVRCNAAGTGTESGAGARSFTINYSVETSGSAAQTRCIGS